MCLLYIFFYKCKSGNIIAYPVVFLLCFMLCSQNAAWRKVLLRSFLYKKLSFQVSHFWLSYLSFSNQRPSKILNLSSTHHAAPRPATLYMPLLKPIMLSLAGCRRRGLLLPPHPILRTPRYAYVNVFDKRFIYDINYI